MTRPRFDVGQIIKDWSSEFYAKYSVVHQVRKSFGAMALCRTRALGGHVEVCPECGEIHVSYNSCRDRHCPKCQNKEREVWIEMRTKKSYMQICEEKGWEIGLCPHCKCRMRVIEILEPSRAPPSKGTSSRSACL